MWFAFVAFHSVFFLTHVWKWCESRLSAGFGKRKWSLFDGVFGDQLRRIVSFKVTRCVLFDQSVCVEKSF